MNVLTFSCLILLLSLLLLLIRAILGPTFYDRVLAVNAAGTKTVLLLIVFGSMFKNPGFLTDIALSYALINFVATIGVLKFFRQRSFAPPLNPATPKNDHA